MTASRVRVLTAGGDDPPPPPFPLAPRALQVLRTLGAQRMVVGHTPQVCVCGCVCVGVWWVWCSEIGDLAIIQ